jgi:hypothetical protein
VSLQIRAIARPIQYSRIVDEVYADGNGECLIGQLRHLSLRLIADVSRDVEDLVQRETTKTWSRSPALRQSSSASATSQTSLPASIPRSEVRAPHQTARAPVRTAFWNSLRGIGRVAERLSTPHDCRGCGDFARRGGRRRAIAGPHRGASTRSILETARPALLPSRASPHQSHGRSSRWRLSCMELTARRAPPLLTPRPAPLPTATTKRRVLHPLWQLLPLLRRQQRLEHFNLLCPSTPLLASGWVAPIWSGPAFRCLSSI